MPKAKPIRPQQAEPQERYSPKTVRGEGFDDLMRRLVRVKPDKPKKGSRPKKK